MLFHETYAGLRVVDLSENIAGPLACMVLADLGADVVKVERPGTGDATRSLPPRWGEESTVFQTYNRNKRSVALDLRTDAGRDAVRRLAAAADVVVESFRPGVADRLGIGFADLSAVNDRLVHVSVNAFGTGPLGHDRPGYDALVQAFTGIMEMTGDPDGGPVRAAPSIIDISTGLWAALSVQAALARRDRTPGPQQLEATLLDSGLFLLGHQVVGYLATGTHPPRLGGGAPSAAPYRVYDTADRPVMVATSTDRQFQVLCAELGLVELAQDPRFATTAARLERRDELDAAVQGALHRGTADHWLSVLGDAGVPVGPVQTLAEAVHHPLVAERGLLAPAAPGRVEGLVQVHLPMDRLRSAPRRQAPAVGEHTREVLQEVGWTPDAQTPADRTDDAEETS